MAMIDALTLAHLRRSRPELTVDLVELDRGPWIPSPAIVVPATTPAARVDDLRAAFVDALADDRDVRDTLLLDGFVPLDRADYAAVLELVR